MLGFIRAFRNRFRRSANHRGLDYWHQQQYLTRGEFRYILWLDRIYQKILTVPGHVVELGVAYGRNAILFGHQIQMNADDAVRKYIGFDTFDGYSSASLQSESHLSSTAWKNISVDSVRERIDEAGVKHLTTLIQGDFLETIPKYVEENSGLRVALLYVDCNSYSAAVKGMELLRSYLSPGAIICIDEKKQGGETKALIEFCEKHRLRYMKDAGPFAIPAYTRIPHTDGSIDE